MRVFSKLQSRLYTSNIRGLVSFAGELHLLLIQLGTFEQQGQMLLDKKHTEMENNKKIGRPTIGIVTDGLHIKKEKMTHYKAVDLTTGEEIFNRTVGNQTTCIGRFIAIVEATKYIFRTSGAPRIIYSDSKVAIQWYYKKQANTKRRCGEVQIAEIYLKVMAAKIDYIQVLHWDSREWGYNPASITDRDDM